MGRSRRGRALDLAAFPPAALSRRAAPVPEPRTWFLQQLVRPEPLAGPGRGARVVPARGTSPYASGYCSACSRDSHGHIARSENAKHDFMASPGYPHGRPGYIIDHIVPLKRGGADTPANMQWQTKADAKAKDRWE